MVVVCIENHASHEIVISCVLCGRDVTRSRITRPNKRWTNIFLSNVFSDIRGDQSAVSSSIHGKFRSILPSWTQRWHDFTEAQKPPIQSGSAAEHGLSMLSGRCLNNKIWIKNWLRKSSISFDKIVSLY